MPLLLTSVLRCDGNGVAVSERKSVAACSAERALRPLPLLPPLLLKLLLLLFVNAEKEFQKRKHLYCMLSGRTSGHSSYWSLEGLVAFCNFMIEVYENKKSYEYASLASHYHRRQKFGLTGGLCDMSLLEYFARNKCHHLVDEGSVVKNAEPYYDCMIQLPEGFEHENGLKKFTFNSGQPFSKYLSTGQHVPFATVHFQGSSTFLMSQFIRKCNDTTV